MSKTKAIEEKLADGSRRVKLSRPLKAPGDAGVTTVTELTFREPTAMDIEECGEAVTFDEKAGKKNLSVVLNPVAMNAMIARLSGIPLPYIRMMRASDWEVCAWAIIPFFVPGMEP